MDTLSHRGELGPRSAGLGSRTEPTLPHALPHMESWSGGPGQESTPSTRPGQASAQVGRLWREHGPGRRRAFLLSPSLSLPKPPPPRHRRREACRCPFRGVATVRLGGGTPRGWALHCLSPGTVLSPLAGNPSRSARPREPGTQPDCLPEEPLGVSGAAPPQSKDWAWGQLPEQPCARRPFLMAHCPEAQCTTDFLELKENGQVPTCLRVWAPRAAGTSLLAVLLSRAPGSLGCPALGLWVPRDRSSRSQKRGGGLLHHGGTFPWVLLGPRAGVT